MGKQSVKSRSKKTDAPKEDTKKAMPAAADSGAVDDSVGSTGLGQFLVGRFPSFLRILFTAFFLHFFMNWIQKSRPATAE